MSAPNAFSGAERLVEAYGLGALVPNTIILGDSQIDETSDEYCDMIANFHNQQRNVLVVHNRDANRDPDKAHPFAKREQIDIWWGGLRGNGGLMMILGYLLQSSREWWDAQVNLKMVVESEDAAEDARQNITRIIDRIRTGAKPEILVSNGRSFNEILHESSKDADLVFLGMAEPDENFSTYYQNIQQRLDGLPTTVMVLAAEEISFGEVLLNQDAFQED